MKQTLDPQFWTEPKEKMKIEKFKVIKPYNNLFYKVEIGTYKVHFIAGTKYLNVLKINGYRTKNVPTNVFEDVKSLLNFYFDDLSIRYFGN